MFTHVNVLTKEIIGAAIEVHRNLGPGLLESAYQRCLARELELKETKSIEAIAPVHEAQLLTYMRLGGWKVGLLINFNVLLLKNGIRRKVLELEE